MKLRPAAWGWVGVGVGIAATDAYLIRTGRDSLSVVFGDGLKHPVKRWILVGTWSYITLHLFANLFDGVVPEEYRKYDLFGMISRAIPRGIIEEIAAQEENLTEESHTVTVE